MPRKEATPLQWDIENEYFEKGYSVICGTDEAGRGPLCGPVAAAAVILPKGLILPGLNDSKKISEKKREKLFDEICEKSSSEKIASLTFILTAWSSLELLFATI